MALRDFLDIFAPFGLPPSLIMKNHGKWQKEQNKKKTKQEAPCLFFLEREIHCEFETSRDKISWAGHISRTNGRHFHYKFHSAISDFLVFLIFLVSFSDLPDSEMAFFRRLYDFHSRFQFPPNNISIRLSARNYGQNNICWINSREQKKNKIKPRNPAAY